MSLISVREYGKIHLGEFDVKRPSISAGQAEFATSLKSIYGFDVFRYVNSRIISAQQYVGAFQLGPHTVEVLPKVGGGERDVRRNLVTMLSETLKLDIAEGEIARLAQQNQSILEVFIRLFCDKLFFEVHRGLVRRYEGCEENLVVLRGRLAVEEQVRRNGANPERLFCRFDEFQENNPLNIVLKAAIRLLFGIARAPENQRRLSELLLTFDGVSDYGIGALPWRRVKFDRLNERYRNCFSLAELFLKNASPDVGGGQSRAFSLFFDMNLLFEEYIGRVVTRTLRPRGVTTGLQSPQKYLAVEEGQQRSSFLMKPDVTGFRNGSVSWILDTKWKELTPGELREGVAQSDLYQMYAYASCYKCTDVVLLYPHHGSLGPTAGVRVSYLLNPWAAGSSQEVPRRVRVATIDLADLKTVPAQLERILLGNWQERRCEVTSVA
jgi:5-methylcytosine-specific restriction enzyme subunit McrC